MSHYYYSDTIEDFITRDPDSIKGILNDADNFDLTSEARHAWNEEISILKDALVPYAGQGKIYFEFSIPRMGKRIDTVLLINGVVFVLEFKVGQKHYLLADLYQVWDYALDLKNFHETSHDCWIVPVLIATEAPSESTFSISHADDLVCYPIKANTKKLPEVIQEVLKWCSANPADMTKWEKGRYSPTPTIVEAAVALYRGHSVESISRRDASAEKLAATTNELSRIIKEAKEQSKKVICFVTGVPGAGKTLVGLKIATTHIDIQSELYSVFLSGNGPLVAILREALTRDKYITDKASEKIRIGNGEIVTRENRTTKSKVYSKVEMFIQNVHHFRDECLIDLTPPIEHVVLFDEAQRAWDKKNTASFMNRKKARILKEAGIDSFAQSEPEFLISCLDRHQNWAVVVCLVGGGQEINTGEAGIKEWIESWRRSFNNWDLYISSRLTDEEYQAEEILEEIKDSPKVNFFDDLHLSVSMRSFRAENVSMLVKHLLERETTKAKEILGNLNSKYPIIITRDLNKAKSWLKQKARGNERYGIVVSSAAERLKPYAIDVKSPTDPIHWFLDDRDDVRSSFYLEDVATEFDIQGLELDWTCVTWDADFRYNKTAWGHYSFCGAKWNNVIKEERKKYQKNAYRVLLTRARQGMIIVVPEGDPEDRTRDPKFYDPTFEYLKSIGFEVI
jgi:hypothetical protein